MKIRSDYVSNSSSSSFVIANCELIDHFSITKQDILNTLIDLYGKEDYEKTVERIKKNRKEHPDWYDKAELDRKDIGPFYIYDLSIKEERKEAIRRWGNLLDGWDANNCAKIANEESKDKERIVGCGQCECYREIMDKICDEYGISFWDMREYSIHPTKKNLPRRFVRSDKKDPKTGCYGHYVPIDREILDFAIKLRKDMGIMTNLDMIKSEVARFFVHADDNELCGGKLREHGVEDSHWDESKKAWVKGDGKWKTDSYTFDRVCELLIAYLEKNGRINLKDQSFMDAMKIDEKYLSELDKKNGELWDFANGKNYTWMDLKHDALTWCMHEG